MPVEEIAQGVVSIMMSLLVIYGIILVIEKAVKYKEGPLTNPSCRTNFVAVHHLIKQGLPRSHSITHYPILLCLCFLPSLLTLFW